MSIIIIKIFNIIAHLPTEKIPAMQNVRCPELGILLGIYLIKNQI